ncbi:MAG: GNAT family N-acetyltransferase [Pseudomonadota bacterium]
MTAETSIREATYNDAETLSNLGGRTFAETFGHLYKPSDLNKFLEKSQSVSVYRRLFNDPLWRAWIAETAAGEAVGYACAGPCDLPVPDRPAQSGELQRFYILAPHQGGGLGGRMLTIALDWLEARFDYLYLSVRAENFGAQRLYRRFGFEKVHDYFYMIGDHADPEWIMKRAP